MNAIGHNSGLSVQKSNAAIRGCITRVRNTLGKYRETVQEALCLIWQHALDYGDCHNAKLLMRAVAPKDRSLVDKWLRATSPIRVNLGKVEAEDKVRLAKPSQASYTEFDEQAMKSLLWWDMPIEEGEEKPLPGLVDYLDAIERAILKPVSTQNSLSKYSEKEQQAIAEEAAALKVLFNRYRAERAARAASILTGQYQVITAAA
jgi:hypothetical protein